MVIPCKTTKYMFLDRDGIINEDNGYVCSPENFIFKDGIISFLKKAQNNYNYKFIIITNQSGIGRGYFDENDFKDLMLWLEKKLLTHGIQIIDVFYCPYHPEKGLGKFKKESNDRKPAPGMILKAAKKYNICLQDSLFIGDRLSDVIAGLNAKVGKIFLLKNKKMHKHDYKKLDCIVIKDFEEVFQYI